MSIASNAHFSAVPRIHRQRTAMPFSTSMKTTFNNGMLVPRCFEILPGDSVDFDVSSVVRMSTPVKPIMDNVILDQYWFFVPSRLVMADFKRVFGELGPNEHWRQTSEVTIPQFTFDDSALSNRAIHAYWYREVDGSTAQRLISNLNADKPGMFLYESSDGGTTKTYVTKPAVYSSAKTYFVEFIGPSCDSLSAYLGFPQGMLPFTGSGSYKTVTQLPFRSYCLIWNEFFRDQNYMDPCDIRYNDNTTVGLLDVHGNVDITTDRSFDLNQWYTDYVTKAVRGAALLPVSRFHDYFSSVLPQSQRSDDILIPIGGYAPVIQQSGDNLTFNIGSSNLNKSLYVNNTGATGFQSVGVNLNTALGSATGLAYSGGLSADLSNIIGMPTMQDLRTSFQLLKYYERSAVGGARYNEYLKAFFDLQIADAVVQRPEFLAWDRQYINISQVIQTSSTDMMSPQGNTAAYSLTTAKGGAHVRKSFQEHGYLFHLVCTRTTRSYQQGYNRMWSRERSLDYYNPVFEHLGMQPVRNYEIWTGNFNSAAYEYNDQVFGFQERYAEYRYHPDIVTGEFSSNSPQPLDFWHFADFSLEPVYMSKEWLFEGPHNLDRCLAVTSDVQHQFQADFYYSGTFTRPMSPYGIPGLADHF